MPKLNLWQLGDRVQAALDALEEYMNSDEYTPEGEKVFWEALDNAEGDVKTKIANYALIWPQYNALADAAKKESDRLARAQKRHNTMADGLKARAKDMMERLNIDRIEDPRVTVWLQDNPPSVEIEDEKKIPKKFWIKQAPRLDRQQILALLKAGKTVLGAKIAEKTRNIQRSK